MTAIRSDTITSPQKLERTIGIATKVQSEIVRCSFSEKHLVQFVDFLNEYFRSASYERLPWQIGCA